MPPGQIIPAMLSWDVAKKVCTAQDFERLACAYLNATSPVDFDATKASAEFGCKPESFKRSIWVIAKKIKENQDGDTTPSAPLATPKSGRKRKAGGENGAEPKKRGTKKAGKKDQENDGDEVRVPIKSENGIGDDLEDEDGDLLQ